MSNAIDCATQLNSTTASALKRVGVTHVGRYLGHGWKGLTVAEVSVIKAAGLNIFSIFEKSPTQVSYFTVSQAKADAAEALNYAKSLGQPVNTAIYFTVDYDAQPADLPAILSYFQTIKTSLHGYKVGVYGSYSVLNYLHQHGVADYHFQTIGWSGGMRNNFLHIYQYQIDKILAGIGVDFDNLEQENVGAWHEAVQPVKSPVKPVIHPNPSPTPVPVMWDGMQLKKGQIGRITILKPINLWKDGKDGKLEFVKILRPTDKYHVFRVYGFLEAHGGQYNLGGNSFVTNMHGYVKYETPSKALLDQVK